MFMKPGGCSLPEAARQLVHWALLQSISCRGPTWTGGRAVLQTRVQ